MRDFMQKVKDLIKKGKGSNVSPLKKEGEHDPYRDWAIIFSIATLIFIFVFSYSIYLFYNLKNYVEGGEGLVSDTKKIFNEKSLIEKIEILNGKKELFEQRKNENLNIVDPSR